MTGQDTTYPQGHYVPCVSLEPPHYDIPRYRTQYYRTLACP